jgi:hypothetical protein
MFPALEGPDNPGIRVNPFRGWVPPGETAFRRLKPAAIHGQPLRGAWQESLDQ